MLVTCTAWSGEGAAAGCCECKFSLLPGAVPDERGRCSDFFCVTCMAFTGRGVQRGRAAPGECTPAFCMKQCWDQLRLCICWLLCMRQYQTHGGCSTRFATLIRCAELSDFGRLRIPALHVNGAHLAGPGVLQPSGCHCLLFRQPQRIHGPHKLSSPPKSRTLTCYQPM